MAFKISQIFSVHVGDMLVGVLNKNMFSKMQEVLLRKEIMCSTRFSTSGVAHLRMTERNTTKRGYALWKRKRDQCRCDDGWQKLCRFCFQTWYFCEEGVYKVYDKKDGTPFMVVSPDGSLRRSADGLVDIHTNPLLSLEIKCLFHLHKGFRCILMYSEVPIRHIPQWTLYGADGPSKWRSLTSLLVSEKWKQSNVSYHNICNAFKCLIISLTLR